jgi:hypothetical protein
MPALGLVAQHRPPATAAGSVCAHQSPAFAQQIFSFKSAAISFLLSNMREKFDSVPTLLTVMRNPDFSTGLPSDCLRVTLLPQG